MRRDSLICKKLGGVSKPQAGGERELTPIGKLADFAESASMTRSLRIFYVSA